MESQYNGLMGCTYLWRILSWLQARSWVAVCGLGLCVVGLRSSCGGMLAGAPWATSQVYQDSVDCIHGSFPTQSHEVCPHVARGEPGQLLVVQVFRQR